MIIGYDKLFTGLPVKLRKELLEEYAGIVDNFYEGRWRPAELHAGRFCEVVYTIISGRAAGAYPSEAKKPDNFLAACKALENSNTLERGLRILAARMLPTLYEIRNNRDVGHVGGDVDPSFMDASYAVSSASWLMAELIRVFHSVSIVDASRAVENLTQLKTPAVWVDADMRRVLKSNVKLSDQCVLLVASANGSVTLDDLQKWTEAKNKNYLKKILGTLHKNRWLEAASPEVSIKLLPPGAAAVRNMLTK